MGQAATAARPFPAASAGPPSWQQPTRPGPRRQQAAGSQPPSPAPAKKAQAQAQPQGKKDKKKANARERTFIMLKPEAVQRNLSHKLIIKL